MLFDWGSLAPLRLRSRLVAEGVYAGSHRSARRGAGIEFGGHRPYTPGDDLRWLDRRSLLRHDHLLVRQFETETDRALRVVVDATESMAYAGTTAHGSGTKASPSKLEFASVVAAALARIAVGSGDPVGLSFLGGSVPNVGVTGGREAFERVLGALESLTPRGDATMDPDVVERAVGGIARTARRGSVVVILSDLLDLPEGAIERMGAICSRGRVVVVVQTLHPDEVQFPFREPTRLRASEGDFVVESDEESRPRYLAELGELTRTWQDAIVKRGGRFTRAVTDQNPVETVRNILDLAR